MFVKLRTCKLSSYLPLRTKALFQYDLPLLYLVSGRAALLFRTYWSLLSPLRNCYEERRGRKFGITLSKETEWPAYGRTLNRVWRSWTKCDAVGRSGTKWDAVGRSGTKWDEVGGLYLYCHHGVTGCRLQLLVFHYCTWSVNLHVNTVILETWCCVLPVVPDFDNVWSVTNVLCPFL